MESFVEYCHEKEYETPVSHARNEFAKTYDGLTDDDKKEAFLYSQRGFMYCVWNRKTSVLYDLRAACFATLSAAEEGKPVG